MKMDTQLDEHLLFQIEVQETMEGVEDDIIILYNYDGAEVTPKLLAETLEELSAQTSLHKNAISTNSSTSKQHGMLSEILDSPFQLEIQASSDKNLEHTFLNLTDDDLNMSADSGPSQNEPDLLPYYEYNSELKVNENNEIRHLTEGNEAIITNKSKPEDNVDAYKDNTQQPYSFFEHRDQSPQNSVHIIRKSEQNTVSTSERKENEDILCGRCNFVTKEHIELQRHNKCVHNEEKPFVCRQCGQMFKLELSLEIHQLKHSELMQLPLPTPSPESFCCPLCDFSYQRRNHLTVHAKTTHGNKNILVCSQCPYSCLTQAALDSHVLSTTHKDTQRVLCPLCGTATKDIKQHYRRAHASERPYPCSQCSFTAKTASNLRAHEFTHNPEKRIMCDRCSYTCHTQEQFRRHLVRHSEDKHFQCSLCQFASKTNTSLKRHMQIHQTPDKYTCVTCGFRTHDKILLRQHKAQEHVLKASHKCPECSVEFDRAVELKKHALAVHKSDKMQFCSYCDFSGATTSDLRLHMQSHFGKFAYACEQCGYACRLKASYKRHMERHTKVKRYTCSLCSYSCGEKYDLQKHEVHRHCTDKPLACPFCEYRCKFKSRLDNHISFLHSDLKPFFCKQCPYTCKSAESLKKHMANHVVVVKAIRCVLCEYSTTGRAQLKRHMQVHIKKAIFQ